LRYCEGESTLSSQVALFILEVFTYDTVQANTYRQAINALMQDNFVYVIFHKQLESADEVADNFLHNTPYYDDDFMAVYKLADLYFVCEPS